MPAIEFKFAIKEEVVIEVTGKNGRVDALFLSEGGPKQIRVEYVDEEGVILSSYFLEDRLVAANVAKAR